MTISLLALLILCPLDAGEPCAQFRVTAQEAYEGWQGAKTQTARIIANALPDDIGREQIRVAQLIEAAWDHLDYVKRCYRNDPDNQARHAAILRSLLGEANFKAGRMPSVFP